MRFAEFALEEGLPRWNHKQATVRGNLQTRTTIEVPTSAKVRASVPDDDPPNNARSPTDDPANDGRSLVPVEECQRRDQGGKVFGREEHSCPY